MFTKEHLSAQKKIFQMKSTESLNSVLLNRRGFLCLNVQHWELYSITYQCFKMCFLSDRLNMRRRRKKMENGLELINNKCWTCFFQPLRNISITTLKTWWT